MTTYTKETALYDTGAIGDDINEAGQTASKYITYVDSTHGIRVYDGNNETVGNPSNYVQLNSDGMEVFNGGNSVAAFGADARIGTEDDASINISPDSITGVGTDNTPVFEFSSTGGTDTILVNKSKVKTTPVTDLGSAIPIDISGGATGSTITAAMRIGNSMPTTTFTYGTSATKTIYFANGVSFSIAYTSSSGTISATQTAGTVTGVRYVQFIAYYYESQTIEAPVYKMGNALEASGWSLALGKFNDNTDDPLFSIGNGTSDTARSNAFAVSSTGAITAAGLPSGLTTELHSVSTGSVSSTSDSGSKTATVTKAGYYPLAVSGWYFAGTNLMYQTLYSCRLSSRSNGSATITYRFYNRSSAAYNGTFYFEILWAKL